jgi:hypothetical protein
MKLFIQEFDDKFINNLSLIESQNSIIINDSVHDNLYLIHYKYDFDAYVFVSSLLTNEIYQYILEFNKSKRIILYHDIINQQIIDSVAQYCTNISSLDMDGVIKIPTLINEHIYFNMNKQRSKYISCFIDSVETLHEDLLSILYPNKKFNIRLFGSSSIRHPQNVGLLSEQDKSEVLNSSEGFLLIDDLYLPEALSCGTKIFRPKQGELVEDKSSIRTNTETYAQFLTRILQS